MNNLLSFIEDCFSYFRFSIVLFPLLGIIYFIKDKKRDKLLLLIGFLLFSGVYLFQEISSLFNIKLSYLFNDIIFNLLILIGLVLVLIAFGEIVNRNKINFNKNIAYYLKNPESFRIVYLLGLLMILTGFIIVPFFILSGKTEKPFLILSGSGIFFTIESFIMILGTFFCFIGLIGTIIKKERSKDIIS